MSTHSPAPWSATRIGDSAQSSKEKGMAFRITSDARHPKEYDVAVVYYKPFMGQAEANAQLIANAPDLLQSLRAISHLAAVLNNRQHAGLPITPTMWSELYRIQHECAAVISKIGPVNHHFVDASGDHDV